MPAFYFVVNVAYVYYVTVTLDSSEKKLFVTNITLCWFIYRRRLRLKSAIQSCRTPPREIRVFFGSTRSWSSRDSSGHVACAD